MNLFKCFCRFGAIACSVFLSQHLFAYTITNTFAIGEGTINGYDVQPIIMDINGDGKDDILILYYNAGVATGEIYFNNGAGFNTPTSTFAVGKWVEAGQQVEYFPMDFNGDGKKDLVAIYAGSNNRAYCQVLNSTGNGFTFLFSGLDVGCWFEGSGAHQQKVKNIAMDINSDGKDDLIRIYNNNNSQAHVQISWSTGSTFQYKVSGIYIGQYFEPAVTNSYLVDYFPMKMHTNGSMLPELIAIYDHPTDNQAYGQIQQTNSDGISFTRITNTIDLGQWNYCFYHPITYNNDVALVMDYNGDGAEDFIVFDINGYALVYLSAGNGTTFTLLNNGSFATPPINGTIKKRIVINIDGNGKQIGTIYKSGSTLYLQTYTL